MKTRKKWLTTAATCFVLFSCSSTQNPPSSTKTKGDAAPTSADSGTGTTLKCGNTTCALPMGFGIELATPCCTDQSECGLKIPAASKCLPLDQKGAGNPACPTFSKGTLFLGGCCGANGQCGALDPFLGCIPNSDLGAPTSACDATNSCSGLVGVACDGPEDCPTGQKCCGEFGGSGYDKFGCYASCANQMDGGGQTMWFEMCHAGGTCENASYSCKTSTYLPSSLARCYTIGNDPPATDNKDPNRVNCGSGACAAGEKCCLRGTDPPYCAPASSTCECHPKGLDAGASKPDGG